MRAKPSAVNQSIANANEDGSSARANAGLDDDVSSIFNDLGEREMLIYRDAKEELPNVPFDTW
jgi:hypothetical protein